jgi:hypothetical protein
MPDAHDLAYFTDVLNRLYALHEAAPEGSSLYRITQEAGADIANLIGHLAYAAARAA